MIMPVSRRELVAGKFIALLVFNTIGAAFGLIAGTAAGIITNKITLTSAAILEQLFLAMAALTTAEILGGIAIPLVFKFGAEKGRVLLLVSAAIPAAICFVFYHLLTMLGVKITDQLVFILLCCSPIAALLWNVLMYKTSCSIFERQEL